MSQGHIDAADGEAGAGAHTVAGELVAIHLSQTPIIVGFHADDQLLERGLDQSHGGGRACAAQPVTPRRWLSSPPPRRAYRTNAEGDAVRGGWETRPHA
jgi:hypothetical protein